jgi:membrane carboxypeptidase/penicillin-binding protein
MRFTIFGTQKRFLFGNEKKTAQEPAISLGASSLFLLHLLHDFAVVVQAGGDVQEEYVVSYSKIKKEQFTQRKQVARVCNKVN